MLLAAMLLTGCTSRSATDSLPVEVSDSFSESGATEIPSRWWHSFDDSRLDSLVSRALQSNFSLEAAWHRLRAARAVADRASSDLWPDLEGSGEGTYTQTGNSDSQQLRLGLSSVYEVDLWGRIRSSVQAEEYRARASMADYRTAALSLSAEVVRTWYQLLEAQNQHDLLQQQIETNNKVLDLLEAQFSSGQIRIADILRQRQLIESTREQRIVAESRIRVLEHQLAVLLGESPQGSVEYESHTLPSLPPLPETGVPTELVQRRPDVQSAFNELRAANEELAAAISNQFPRLTLSVSASTSSDNATDLFQDWVTSLSGSLVAPLFNAGALRAEVDRAEAVRDQRLSEFGQTILRAFQEVENALVQEAKQAERVASIEEQVSLAEQTYEQLQQEYFNGVGNYIDVLTTLTDLQQLRRSLLSSRLTLIEYRVALYRALAGGFETEREISSNES
ncbi:MAG: TolC family protein [Candidatus Marinimicrobia bacterium]|nr:TolC family protein [Candidatus Neomarinimicrobiota bacterium]MCF7829334.1 TolC family protein [Candidatus Neomarinimicrobiota bacterium]MCF7880004.1 TolC family protein [Candidatus Neomarinimicrobiota bacterium]